MRHTARALAALVVVAALLLAVVIGCGADAGGGATPAPASTFPDISGVIEKLTPGDDDSGPSLLVVGDASATSAYDRAFVRVTAKTVVWASGGDGRRELSVTDLRINQRIAVRFTGPVAESYPVQATAADIEILSPVH